MIFYMQSIIVAVNFGKTKKKQKSKTTQNSVRSTVWFSFCQICLHSFIHSTHFHWAFVPRTYFRLCCCSVSQSYPALCNHMDCSKPGLPVPHHLPEFAQIHVHWISDPIQPSHRLLPSFPLALNLSQHQRLFPMSQLFTSGGPSIGASASVLPMSIQGWFPSGLTGWISLQSKGLSRVFSSTTIESISSSVFSLLYDPTLRSIYDY